MVEAAPVPRRRQTNRNRERAASAQYLLNFVDPPDADPADPAPANRPSGVIPFRAKPRPQAETLVDSPQAFDIPQGPAPYDPYPGKFTMIPRAIAEDYGPRLGPTRTRIYEAMHHLVYAYRGGETDKTVKRHQRGQISYGEIAGLAGISVRTVERQMPRLIEAGFVKRLARGQRNKQAAIYELTFKAPIRARVVGPSGGRVEDFPKREDYRQAVGSEDQLTTDKMSVVEASEPQGTTDKMSGNYKEEINNKEKSSSSRSGPSAWPPGFEAVIKKFYPKATGSAIDKAHSRLIKDFGSTEPFLQNVDEHGAAVKKSLRTGHDNPTVFALRVSDMGRKVDADNGSSAKSGPSPPSAECLKCDGTGRRTEVGADGNTYAKPCRCDEPDVGLTKRGLCPKHEHEVVWYPERGVELCVECDPPPPELRAKADRMRREWFEAEKFTGAQPQAP